MVQAKQNRTALQFALLARRPCLITTSCSVSFLFPHRLSFAVCTWFPNPALYMLFPSFSAHFMLTRGVQDLHRYTCPSVISMRGVRQGSTTTQNCGVKTGRCVVVSFTFKSLYVALHTSVSYPWPITCTVPYVVNIVISCSSPHADFNCY